MRARSNGRCDGTIAGAGPASRAAPAQIPAYGTTAQNLEIFPISATKTDDNHSGAMPQPRGRANHLRPLIRKSVAVLIDLQACRRRPGSNRSRRDHLDHLPSIVGPVGGDFADAPAEDTECRQVFDIPRPFSGVSNTVLLLSSVGAGRRPKGYMDATFAPLCSTSSWVSTFPLSARAKPWRRYSEQPCQRGLSPRSH